MRKKRSESGQAILEFLIVIMVVVTLAFMVIQVSLGLAWGHYVQYATYMASRALFSGALTRQDQEEAAKLVLEKMVKAQSGKDLLSFVATPRIGEERDIQGPEAVAGAFIGTHPRAREGEDSRTYGWAQGVQYNFQVKLFMLPVSTWVSRTDSGTIQMGTDDAEAPPVQWKGQIPFTSDSWLGREVSESECIRDMQEMSGSDIGRADRNDFLYDNGC